MFVFNTNDRGRTRFLNRPHVRGWAKVSFLWKQNASDVLSTILLMPLPTGRNRHIQQRTFLPILVYPETTHLPCYSGAFPFYHRSAFGIFLCSHDDGQGKERTWNFPACTTLKCHLTACLDTKPRNGLARLSANWRGPENHLASWRAMFFPTQQTSQFILQWSQY